MAGQAQCILILFHASRDQTASATSQRQIIVNLDPHTRKMDSAVVEHFETKQQMSRGIFNVRKIERNLPKLQQMEGKPLTIYQRFLLSVMIVCGFQQWCEK